MSSYVHSGREFESLRLHFLNFGIKMYNLNKTKEIITNIIYKLANENGTRSNRLLIVYHDCLTQIFNSKIISKIINNYCPEEYTYLKNVLWDEILKQINNQEMKKYIDAGISADSLIRNFHYSKSKKIIYNLISIHSKLNEI